MKRWRRDVVVVNHHPSAAIALRLQPGGRAAASVDIAIFDEAHPTGRGRGSDSSAPAGRALLDFARDLLTQPNWLHAACKTGRARIPWLERAARELRLTAAGPAGDGGAPSCGPTEAGLARARSWSPRWANWPNNGPRAGGAGGCGEASPDFQRLQERAQSLRTRRHSPLPPAGRRNVRWIDVRPQQVRLVESPSTSAPPCAGNDAARLRAGSSPRPRWVTTSSSAGSPKVGWPARRTRAA